MSKDVLKTNERLCDGDTLMSSNGQWKAVFQCDGNFVIYGWKASWDSDTDGTDGTCVVMQPDGNLVIYNNCNKPRWETKTYTSGAQLDCYLKLTNDGHLVLFKEGKDVWSSANSKGIRLYR